MRWRQILCAVLGLGAALFLAPSSGRADPIDLLAAMDAPVEYTADYTLTEGDQTWRGTIVHAPQRERRDFTTRNRDAGDPDAPRH